MGSVFECVVAHRLPPHFTLSTLFLPSIPKNKEFQVEQKETNAGLYMMSKMCQGLTQHLTMRNLLTASGVVFFVSLVLSQDLGSELLLQKSPLRLLSSKKVVENVSQSSDTANCQGEAHELYHLTWLMANKAII